MLELLSIGEVMAELRRDKDGAFAVGFAGDSFNTAVYAARQIGQPGAVAYVTRIGTDPLSRDFLGIAAAENLDCTGIGIDQDRAIGIYAVSTDAAGERSFSYWRSSSAARMLFADEAGIAALPQARITYISGISLAILSPQARRRIMDQLAARVAAGGHVAFDSNYRPALWEDADTARAVIGAMWDMATIALPSIDDEMALFGDATEQAVLDRFAAKNWHACAIKRGVRGPVSPGADDGGDTDFPPAPKIVDTTAAGDSFNAGFLAALLSGAPSAAALQAGHALAAKVVAHPGAIIPQKNDGAGHSVKAAVTDAGFTGDN